MYNLREYFSLSITQQDIYFDQLHQGSSPLYNIGGYVRCGMLDIDKISLAHRQVVLNHDAFGVRIVQQEGRVQQYISTQRSTDLAVIDFSAAAKPERAAQQWLTQLFANPIAYDDTTLCFGYLIKLSLDAYWYVGFAHHLAMDGWGFANWAGKLADYYNQYDKNSVIATSWREISLKDQAYPDSQKYQLARNFWLQHCDNLPEKLLPAHYQADFKAKEKIASRRHVIELSRSTFSQLADFAQTMNAGIPQLFLGMLASYFSLAYERDILSFGIPAHNRKNFAQKKMIGVFTSVSPLILTVDKTRNFKQLVQYIASQQKVSLRHQKYPIGHLIRELGLSKDQAQIYDISFNYLKLDYSQLAFGGINADVVYQSHHHEQVPLTVTIWDGDNSNIELQLDYNLAYFSDEEIALLGRSFEHLLTVLPANAEAPLSELNIIPPAQQQELLQVATTRPEHAINLFDKHGSFIELFETRVAMHPNKIAVFSAEVNLTYQQLDQQSNQLAHYLIAQGVTAQAPVALCTDRSTVMLIALLAILKSGSAYLPLEPNLPASRLQFMLKDSAASLLLLGQRIHQLELVDHLSVVLFEQKELWQEYPLTKPERCIDALDLAYLIYTSGTTGQPKGVKITHRSVLNFLFSMQQAPGFSDLDRLLAVTPISFDIHVLELYLPLICGGQLVISSRGDSVDGKKLARLLEQHDISVMQATPSTWRLLLESQCWQQKIKVLCGGEVLDRTLVSSLRNHSSALWNMYGPTETTVWSSCVDLTATDSNITIGQPIANTEFYVLNNEKKLQAIGIYGELYIGGAGLAAGYLGQNDLTKDRFIEQPLLTKTDVKLYATGDLVRRLPDGRFEIGGRIDEQVKIRGYRIELTEISARLTQIEQIKSAVVVAYSDHGSSRLIAYVVPSNLKATSESELSFILRQELMQSLPEYMIPTAFVMLAELPVTVNGKVDKKQLPAPDKHMFQGIYKAPSTSTEATLVTIWTELLQHEKTELSVTANFFMLGGHSLSAMRLVAQIRDVFSVELSLDQIFNARDLAELATIIDNTEQVIAIQVLKKMPLSHAQLPLSFAQQRLWFINQLEQGSTHYNMPFAFKILGAFDSGIAEQVFLKIIARHQSLRTVFSEQDHGVVLTVNEHVDFTLKRHDLRRLSLVEQQARVLELQQLDNKQLFDLSCDVMLRVSYLQLSEEAQQPAAILLFNMHHIASDGWSMAVLVKEFVTLYQRILVGKSELLPPLNIQYTDYAYWQREWLKGDMLAQQLSYWKNQLDQVPALHSLPLDYPRPAVKKYQGAIVSGGVNAQVHQRLEQQANNHNMTLFMLLQAMFSLVLSRHSNSSDIIIGTPVANRMHSELAPLIGFFANTLVLRANTDFKDSSEYLNHIRQINLDAQANQDVPFDHLVEHCNIHRSTRHTPLFQIMFNIENDEAAGLDMPDLVFTQIDNAEITAKFDLNVTAQINEQGISFSWEYDCALFERESIERLNEHFQRIVCGISENIPELLTGLDMLSMAEEKELLIDLNSPNVNELSLPLIHQIFEEQVLQNPEVIALECAGQQLSYIALNQQANQLAHYLREQGVGVNSLVGLCFERSEKMIISLLAILKAGAAYVPLDANYPQSRLTYIAKDSSMMFLLTQHAFCGVIAGVDELVVDSDEFKHQLASYSNENLGVLPAQQSHNLAYICYTSGSTGQPKGVMQTHQTLSNLVQAQQLNGQLSVPLRTLQFTSIAFDVSAQELTTSWFTGSTLILLEQASRDDLNVLFKVIVEKKVQRLFIAQAVLNALAEVAAAKDFIPTDLIEIVASSEQLFISESLSQFLSRHPKCSLWNHYGPTETHVATVHQVTDILSATFPPIGKVLSNVSAYVLDKQLRLVPRGCIGELYISGCCVAKGYLNLPDETAQKFIQNPFSNDDQRLYATGDLVSYLTNGDLQYHGRTDEQVKIRGFRIELGEVEQSLSQLECVQLAVVIMREDTPGDKRLVAYFSAEAKDNMELASIDYIRGQLAQQLPDHMVPAVFVSMDIWPYNANGKIDKKALPVPDWSLLQGEYIAPVTSTEQYLVNIWARLLNMDADNISIAANFFELGGHSLLSVRLVSEVRQQLASELPVKVIFDAPTIQELAAWIDTSQKTTIRQAVVTVKRDNNESELSFAQQRLWFIDQLQGGSPEYNMPAAFSVEGDFNVKTAEQALAQIISRHEVLRTVYHNTEQGALQQINAEVDFNLTVEDLTSFVSKEKQDRLEAFIEADVQRPFDLSKDLMVRAIFVLLEYKTDKSLQQGALLFNMHHIAADGWSINVLIREFTSHYQAISEGKGNPLPALDIQYADYAHWQRQWLQGEVLETQLSYWEQQLAEVPSVHNLILDKPRPEQQTFNGANVIGELSAEIACSLKKQASRYQLTPFMLLHSALALVLSRHSNSNDIVIGTPVANRLQAELEPLIGFFVNTLVLRVDTAHTQLSDYLSHVRQVHLAAQSHQDVPFEQLVERLHIPRSTAHTPLFQILLTTNTDYALNSDAQGEGNTELALSGINLTTLTSKTVTAKFDLEINISISDNGVALNWNYNTDLFSAAHIAVFNDHLCCLLTGLSALSQTEPVATPMLNDLPMLSAQEHDHLINSLNDTTMDYPQNQCIHELFEAQAKANPDKIALEFEGEKLTYQALNHKANQLAHYLIEEHQVTPDTLVGICVERSLDMVIGILAILKAGGAYVPLDPTYPAARLNYILDDAQVSVVLTQTAVISAITFVDKTSINLTEQTFLHYPVDNIKPVSIGLNSEHLAYVLYTSGSTGQPKGVMMSRRVLINLLQGMAVASSRLSAPLKTLQFFSIGFDMAFFDVFVCLSSGGCLQLIPSDTQKDLMSLMHLITTENIARLNLPYAVLQQLTHLSELENLYFPSLEVVTSTAEQLIITSELRSFFTKHSGCQLINHYGPSETHVVTTLNLADSPSDWPNIPSIGQFLPNVNGYILDANNQLVPYGAEGELHIAEATIAKGYLNLPELTQERFIANPYIAGQRLYKTGDLVRYLADGNLKYIGRIDEQVKIRGFRIELGEIEHQLNLCDGIDGALVLAKDSVDGHKQLIAYLQPSLIVDCVSDENALDSAALDSDTLISEVKQFLAQSLPGYMVPQAFVLIAEWPLTPNGKIDKKALPEPDASLLQGEYIAPQVGTEQMLVQIWSGLLSLDANYISIIANFFDLGGYSLLSVRLVSEIRQQLSIELPVKVIFEIPTIKGLAAWIDNSEETQLRQTVIPVTREGNETTLSFAQQRLWFIDKLQEGSPEYNMPVAFAVEGDFNVKTAEQVLSQIIRRHEVLRTVYHHTELGALQQIQTEFDFSLTVEDLTSLAANDKQKQLQSLIETDVQRPFNLAQDLMVRASFVLLEPKTDNNSQQGALLFNMHHIASDGWSLAVLINEFTRQYKAISDGQETPLLPLEIQYADYAHWQKEWLQGEILETQLSYWEQQLAEVPAVHNLVLDHPRPEQQTFNGANVIGELSAEIACSLKKQASRYQLTPFMLLHSALALVLSRHSNSNDIVIGTPVANRLQAELEPLIGFFVNTLVLRVDTAHTQLSDYLSHVRQVHLAAQSHQDVPFEQLVERLHIPRSTAHTPLFQILLTTNTDYALNSDAQGEGNTELALSGINLTTLTSKTVTAKFDLEINISISDNGVALNWNYNTDLFSAAHIAVFNDHLCCLLTGLSALSQTEPVATPMLNDLPMLSAQEHDHLINSLNDTTMDYPQNQCIHELFEAQAKANPDKIALEFEGEKLTYQALNHKANQLAHYLIEEHQVTPDTLVGICVERSLDMVIGILAILKAGGAYVPLDPTYPAARLNYILDDAQVSVVLTQTAVISAITFVDKTSINLTEQTFLHYPVDNIKPVSIGLNSEHLAYVLYTSGSTGQPKGVMMSRRVLINLLQGMAVASSRLSAPLKTLQFFSIGFDMAFFDVFVCLSSGGCLQLIPSDTQKDLMSLMHLITTENIARLNLPYAVLQQLTHLSELENLYFPSLEVVTSTAEQLIITSELRSFFTKHSGCQLINHYGPSETHVVTTLNLADSPSDWPNIPSIGQFLPNVNGYILDANNQLVPYGAEGELHIAEATIAKGYLNLPELTQERFIANPYIAGQRLYKTGDLVRYLADGNLEYIGRIDEQVKIRGFRIELGEIEHHLSLCDNVASSLVMAIEDKFQQKQLVAYVQSYLTCESLEDKRNFINLLLQHLKYILPVYMVPSTLILINEWPLTLNGKINRKELPAQDLRLLQTEFIGAETETEKRFVTLCSKLLQLEANKISLTANFFDLGGHSLLAVRLVSMINSSFSITLSIQNIFDVKTLRDITIEIDYCLTIKHAGKRLEQTEIETEGWL